LVTILGGLHDRVLALEKLVAPVLAGKAKLLAQEV
jgi:hypothetical protein